jgi:FtsP/CotA-like multicopper oxidase with cupredoxin domain
MLGRGKWLSRAMALLVVSSLLIFPGRYTPAQVGEEEELLWQLFPPDEETTLPAVPFWGFPEFTGEPALEPLPDAFDIVEQPAWFDGIPLTIRPFPRPSIGDGGPDDNHADMWVFFYADGTPVPQLPLLEVVPLNIAGEDIIIPDIAARLFSANWEIHVVRVPQDYVPGSIRGLGDIGNPLLVLEDIQTNMFVTFPILPQQFTIPNLELNNLAVEHGIFEGNVVSFVEYDLGDNEFVEKPMYLFRKPSGEFVGNAVLSGIPGMPLISSFWEVFTVEVPEDYIADSLRSEDEVLASGYHIIEAFEVFAPVEAVDGIRTRFPDFMDVLTGPDDKFRKDSFPLQTSSLIQDFDNDPRINPDTLGFTSTFSFNEVEIPRVFLGQALVDVDVLLEEALGEPPIVGPLILPPHIARQLLVQDGKGDLTHLEQKNVDIMPLEEIISRGQALFEREIFEEDGAGPNFNAYSCATCHGLPFHVGVEPNPGGSGTRFRNALQPTDSGLKTMRNAPHVFGSGTISQLNIERHAGGLPVTDENPNPFGWKGVEPTLRAFTAGALKSETGLESVEEIAELAGVSLDEAASLDLDNDGHVAEMSVGDVTALAAFQASLPRPFQINPGDPAVIRGREIFGSTGCDACHTPLQTLQSTTLRITNPETSGEVLIDLGPPDVELFSDLKRHSMGSLLAEPGPQGGIPADVFRTPPLWGLADSAPYLHDGSANTIEEAIMKHGGEAQSVKEAFANLPTADKNDMLGFLSSLVLPKHPQMELDAFNRLSSGDKNTLNPLLESFTRVIVDRPLLTAWMVNPPPEGIGSVSGVLTVQVSITSELGLEEAFIIVDSPGSARLPLVFNLDTGFHEVQINTTTMSEGDHRLKLEVLDRSGQRAIGAINTFITVDNIPDTAPAGILAEPVPFDLSTIPEDRIKTFNISAIDVTMTLNRYGDHDPLGKMYVLDENIPVVREQEAKPLPDRVSNGLRDDPIQPLVIRANIGDLVVINFTNQLAIGRASMRIHGLSVDPETSLGSFVGKNTDTLADRGETITYTWFIPDQRNMEGSYVFNSMGDSRQQQAHGLFGVLNVEPKGSVYLSPVTGGPIKSGWEAIIVDPNGKDFREDTIVYHEVGDEEFEIVDKDGDKLPQVDPFKTYRPASRALNYRSEPFFRRRELVIDVLGHEDESQNYGSYMFGDPPTPIPRGYVGDPTKRRIVHAGSERAHVEHLHGGSIRWRFDPFVEPDQWGLPFDKNPPPQSLSQRMDSQFIHPTETYTIATEGAAGGLQAGPGEYLFHCHFAHHYTAGMWSFWRVFDTLQTGASIEIGSRLLVELPDRVGQTPMAVDSAQLIGMTMPSGRTLVDGPTTTTTLNIGEWIQGVLPPQGVPQVYDASVWDWIRQETPGGPLYMSEPEDTRVWANYASPAPGQRLPIMFNSNNGRPAFPLLRPHLGKRPPFSPGRSGSPYLGEPDADHPDSLIPAGARRLQYVIVTSPMPVTFNEKFGITNEFAALTLLDEDKEDILAGRKNKEQLTIRANVGDGVDVIHYSEAVDDFFPFSKANIHIHFVQFDTQASDGVITGLSYEQSVRSYLNEGPNNNGIRLTQLAPAGTNTLTVDNASTLQVNAFLGVGFGVAHNQPNGFEFAQIVAKSGNTLTLDRPLQKEHPAGQYVGVEFVRHQWYADAEVGTTYFHNHVFAVPGFGLALSGALIVEPEGSTWHDPVSGDPIRSGAIADIITDRQVVPGTAIQSFREFVLHMMNAITGIGESEGGEPGGFNMRQEPLEQRLAINIDPSLLFSSVTHGDPATPLLRSYVGDLAVIRLLNSSGHDGGVFHLTGHNFRLERFDLRETPKDAVLMDISERWDLFFTAGGAGMQPGDYLYMNSMHEKTVDGAWGVMRVYDTLQPDLQPLRVPIPPEGPGFPQNTVTGGRPPGAFEPDNLADLKLKLERYGYNLPPDLPVRTFDVVAVETNIEFARDYKIGEGRAYVLTEDEAAVLAGTKALEPLVLRTNVGEVVRINFTNHLPISRASFHIPGLTKTTDSLGGAFGFNNDSTVAPGETVTHWYVIDPDIAMPRSFVITDFGDPLDGAQDGLYGAFIIEPAGSTFHDPRSGVEVDSGVAVDVRSPSLPGGGFRDVALIFHDDDHVMNRDVMPYRIEVRGVRGINYRAEPFAERLEQDLAISRIFRTGGGHVDPRTTIIQATAGDAVHLHVLGAFGHHPHVFSVDGHRFPFDINRPDASHFSSRGFGRNANLDVVLEHGAGGILAAPGDYLYSDRRNPFLEAGLWGIMRVAPKSEASLLPLGDLVPGWNLVSRSVIPESTSVVQFLESINGKFDQVAGIDSADPTNWLTFSPTSENNTLAELSHVMGFWIHIIEPVFLSPRGTLPTLTQIPLQPGWNLVGWPSYITKPAEQALASIDGQYDLVYAYEARDTTDPWKKFDPTASFGNDLIYLRPLLGYWIQMTEAGMLTVENF